MSFWKAFIHCNDVSGGNEKVEDIKYHLVRLLESEAALVPIDGRHTELYRSSFKFGVEDIHLLNACLDQAQLALWVGDCIRNFEPRLTNVRVELADPKEGDNAITLHIVAKVKADAKETDLMFDSKISRNNLKALIAEVDYD